jgi:hypothetical protein
MAGVYAVDVDKPKKKKKDKKARANFNNNLADSMSNNAGSPANPPAGLGNL